MYIGVITPVITGFWAHLEGDFILNEAFAYRKRRWIGSSFLLWIPRVDGHGYRQQMCGHGRFKVGDHFFKGNQAAKNKLLAFFC